MSAADETAAPADAAAGDSFSVAADHPALAGHFPGDPVMPETLIMEAMAQASIMLLTDQMGQQRKFDVFLG